jgi:hypothetical protein
MPALLRLVSERPVVPNRSNFGDVVLLKSAGFLPIRRTEFSAHLRGERQHMATMTATPHQIVPLHLSGNTTEQQNRMLQDFLGEAVQEAYKTAIEQLDRQSAQAVLDMDKKLKHEVAEKVVEIIHRHTVSDKYKDEEVSSNRVYPPTYRVRPIEAQVTELRKAFPSLGSCQEKLARRELPEGAEAWFAIPRWQAVASTYNEAVEMMLGVLASKRRFSNRIAGKLGAMYLRQAERSKLAEKILGEQQEGSDIHGAGGAGRPAASRLFRPAHTRVNGRKRVRSGRVFLRLHAAHAS